ncbi:MAG: hypothetical protein GXP26_09765 [Planctomycetes bacterium]|nr:hypothetical protein [Planctomycetota bacterium]
MVQLIQLNLVPNFLRGIRNRQMLMAVVLVLSANSALVGQQFPYVAYADKPDIYVRSGPGQRYYPTQQLQQGHAVEVYRHDGDGWCAVRPPEGSFSLVATHQVNQLGQGVAEVSAEQTVTRVGSLLSPERSAIQVLLTRGERIKVLDSAGADVSRWLRIAAPAGEFRWIAAEDLSPQPPVESSHRPQTPTSWTRRADVAPASAQQVVQQAGVFDHLKKSPGRLQPTETVTIPSSETHSPLTASESDAMDIVAGSPAELQLAQFQAQGTGLQTSQLEQAITPTTGNGPNATSTQPRIRFQGRTSPQAPSTPRVAELELRLSEIVIRSPVEWHFGQLKNEANGLLVATDLPGERTRLRDVLERITRFEQVQRRYTMTSVVGAPAAPTVVATQPVTLATASPLTAEAPRKEFTGRTANVLKRVEKDLLAGGATESASDSEAPLYDAVGILKPVISKREKAPQFALVDDKGEVVSFVTPTPDLNLQPYLGQRIGVHGTRDYMQEFRRAHVTAGRITPVEGRMRR